VSIKLLVLKKCWADFDEFFLKLQVLDSGRDLDHDQDSDIYLKKKQQIISNQF